MNLSDPEILELSDLCSALVDGKLTPAQRDRLNQWLATSSDARRFYVYHMTLSASLHDYASEMQAEDPIPAATVIRGPAKWWGIGGSLAAAASIALALWVAFSGGQNRGARVAASSEEEEVVATLSGLSHGKWEGFAPSVGTELRRGQQLHLLSGIAEISFACGAQVELEGPATLDLNSAWDAALHRGSLKASVPSEAIGFRVWNADVEVTDLGTEFSMVAAESGGTEVFVLQGMVQAAGRADQKTLTLRDQQAWRFEWARVSEVRDREQKLARLAMRTKLQQISRPAGYAHWSFDETEGPVMKAETTGTDERSLDAKLFGKGDLAELRTEGRRKRALALDGQTSLVAQGPEIAGDDGATVSFWVRISEDAPLPESGAMIAWRRGESSLVQISWNRDPATGALGALRTDTEHGFMVGTTPLRDGRWHHVAVVLGAAGRPRQYVDGKLESITAKRFKRARPEMMEKLLTRTGLGANKLWLGRSAILRDGAEHFRGTLDELFLADRALTPPEIRRLLRDNRLVAPVLAETGRRMPPE